MNVILPAKLKFNEGWTNLARCSTEGSRFYEILREIMQEEPSE